MYTRCPSCKSEISFEPPANLNNLPEGYKHRIRCPNCGVTIGVKIPRQEAYLEAQPTFTPANPNATSFEPVYNAGEARPYTNENAAAAKPAKKKGTGRNIFMLVSSLIFIALSVVGYLVHKGIIPMGTMTWLKAFTYVDGIEIYEGLFTNLDAVTALYGISAAGWIVYLIPLFLFTLAGINAIVAIISLIGKKYGRAYNVVMSALIFIFAALCVFRGFFLSQIGINGGRDFVSSMMWLINQKLYGVFAAAALGLIQFIFSLFFMKSLVKKEKA